MVNRRAFLLGAGASVAAAVPLAKSIAQSTYWWEPVMDGRASAGCMVERQSLKQMMLAMSYGSNRYGDRNWLFMNESGALKAYDVGRGQWPSV